MDYVLPEGNENTTLFGQQFWLNFLFWKNNSYYRLLGLITLLATYRDWKKPSRAGIHLRR
jgi:hypothetical protein